MYTLIHKNCILIQTCPELISVNPVFPRFQGPGVKAISKAAPIAAPMHWLKIYRIDLTSPIFCPKSNPKVTAGLIWHPLTWPMDWAMVATVTPKAKAILWIKCKSKQGSGYVPNYLAKFEL